MLPLGLTQAPRAVAGEWRRFFSSAYPVFTPSQGLVLEQLWLSRYSRLAALLLAETGPCRELKESEKRCLKQALGEQHTQSRLWVPQGLLQAKTKA